MRLLILLALSLLATLAVASIAGTSSALLLAAAGTDAATMPALYTGVPALVAGSSAAAPSAAPLTAAPLVIAPDPHAHLNKAGAWVLCGNDIPTATLTSLHPAASGLPAYNLEPSPYWWLLARWMRMLKDDWHAPPGGDKLFPPLEEVQLSSRGEGGGKGKGPAGDNDQVTPEEVTGEYILELSRRDWERFEANAVPGLIAAIERMAANPQPGYGEPGPSSIGSDHVSQIVTRLEALREAQKSLAGPKKNKVSEKLKNSWPPPQKPLNKAQIEVGKLSQDKTDALFQHLNRLAGNKKFQDIPADDLAGVDKYIEAEEAVTEFIQDHREIIDSDWKPEEHKPEDSDSGNQDANDQDPGNQDAIDQHSGNQDPGDQNPDDQNPGSQDPGHQSGSGTPTTPGTPFQPGWDWRDFPHMPSFPDWPNTPDGNVSDDGKPDENDKPDDKGKPDDNGKPEDGKPGDNGSGDDGPGDDGPGNGGSPGSGSPGSGSPGDSPGGGFPGGGSPGGGSPDGTSPGSGGSPGSGSPGGGSPGGGSPDSGFPGSGSSGGGSPEGGSPGSSSPGSGSPDSGSPGGASPDGGSPGSGSEGGSSGGSSGPGSNGYLTPSPGSSVIDIGPPLRPFDWLASTLEVASDTESSLSGFLDYAENFVPGIRISLLGGPEGTALAKLGKWLTLLIPVHLPWAVPVGYMQTHKHDDKGSQAWSHWDKSTTASNLTLFGVVRCTCSPTNSSWEGPVHTETTVFKMTRPIIDKPGASVDEIIKVIATVPDGHPEADFCRCDPIGLPLNKNPTTSSALPTPTVFVPPAAGLPSSSQTSSIVASPVVVTTIITSIPTSIPPPTSFTTITLPGSTVVKTLISTHYRQTVPTSTAVASVAVITTTITSTPSPLPVLPVTTLTLPGSTVVRTFTSTLWDQTASATAPSNGTIWHRPSDDVTNVTWRLQNATGFRTSYVSTTEAVTTTALVESSAAAVNGSAPAQMVERGRKKGRNHLERVLFL
ncbi:hypothetical protein H2203_007253 [Taxawa tesnikishii (nom. ined.)]|nr:hypothetical protein H2203_007253 [Dothideales sp. JES 119]